MGKERKKEEKDDTAGFTHLAPDHPITHLAPDVDGTEALLIFKHTV